MNLLRHGRYQGNRGLAGVNKKIKQSTADDSNILVSYKHINKVIISFLICLDCISIDICISVSKYVVVSFQMTTVCCNCSLTSENVADKNLF